MTAYGGPDIPMIRRGPKGNVVARHGVTPLRCPMLSSGYPTISRKGSWRPMLVQYGLSYSDSFWTDFLQPHSLNQNDLVVHNHPSAIGNLVPVNAPDRSSNLSTLGKFSEVRHIAPTKRKAPHQQHGRAKKRQNICITVVPPSGLTLCSERGPRRSRRSQDQRAASKAVDSTIECPMRI
ncbi:hypothetical protein C8Q73DRAFT_699901 [Cubamyces lactineus]|nr:hypothetical protein C8Q73DRAFT_699901 [Cubamyces lactineus]